MARVLLVDDQKEVVSGIRRFLTESFDEITVYEAYDGARGYELALTCAPDVIVVDIMMPGMDGLQMIRRLKREGLRSRFIILSAHEKFDYARQAIELNVDEYLVKPVTRKQIYLSVAKQLYEMKNQVARALYTDVLLNEYLSGADIFLPADAVFEMSGLNELPMRRFAICLFSLTETHEPHELAEWLAAMERALTGSGAYGYLYHTYGRCVVAILNFDDVPGPAILALQRALPADYALGISSAQEALDSLLTLYREAEIASEHARRMAVQSVNYEEIAGENAIIGHDTAQSLMEAIGRGDRTLVWTLLDQLLAKLTVQGVPVESCKKELSSLIRAMDAAFCPDEDKQNAVLAAIEKAPSLLSLKRIVHERSADWLLNGEERAGGKNALPPAIQVAANYLSEHLAENLTVAQLANVANLSYYYFSALFAKSTGMTVKEYLLDARLFRAAGMLAEDMTMRVGDIAAKCGFENVRYFSSCFKRRYGETPQRYRATLSGGGAIIANPGTFSQI